MSDKKTGETPASRVEQIVLWASHFLRFLGLALKDAGLFALQVIGAVLMMPFWMIGLPFLIAWEVWLKDRWNEAKR